MPITIVDPVAPAPYTLETLRTRALGGTEATVIRVAEGLDAVVRQHNRRIDEGRYRMPAAPRQSGGAPTHLLVMREAAAALEQQQRYPGARTWLWLHDLAGPENGRGARLLGYGARLAEARITVVCVSDFHAAQVRGLFRALSAAQRPRVVRIYNPVVVPGAATAGAEIDRDKLAFFSSPHKGLDYALYLFRHLHRRNPALRLYIANPGYRDSALAAQAGVINLGALPHHEIMAHLRSSLCAFYPNYVYAETFGLVLAESNAMGTPVMTHPLGAAAEVLNGEGQMLAVPRLRPLADGLYWRWPALRGLVDPVLNRCGAARGYEALLKRWQDGGRPLVAGQQRFGLAAVLDAWRAEFDTPMDTPVVKLINDTPRFTAEDV
jgi:glycosyltransferase involved in cell wall biosynthesis